MGSFLDKPVTEKHTLNADEAKNGMVYGASSMQGWRVDMEDAHTCVVQIPGLEDHAFYAVYDGHGGSLVATHAGQAMLEHLQRTDAYQAYAALSSEERTQNCAEGVGGGPEGDDQLSASGLLSDALKAAFLAHDETCKQLPPIKMNEDHSGCTAIASIVTPTHIVVANSGDSRGAMSSGGETIALSFDHKPYNAGEQARIEAAGGTVSLRRVNGDLAVSRALGDFMYKDVPSLPAEDQKVTALPDILIRERQPNDEYMLIACDGIWDVVSNEQCMDLLREILSEGEGSCGLVAEEVLDSCLEKNSRDNMTAVFVRFEAGNALVGEGEGVAARKRAREEAERQKLERGDSDFGPAVTESG